MKRQDNTHAKKETDRAVRVPKCVDDILRAAISYFLIPPHLHIYVEMADMNGNSNSEHERQDGRTEFDLPYFRAKIMLDPGQISDHEMLIETIGHEVAHVLIGMCWYPFGNALYSQYGGAKWIPASFNVAEEQLATMMGRMFVRDYTEWFKRDGVVNKKA
jgi:hypothetical protein